MGYVIMHYPQGDVILADDVGYEKALKNHYGKEPCKPRKKATDDKDK